MAGLGKAMQQYDGVAPARGEIMQPDPVNVGKIAFHLVLLAALKKALSNIARDETLARSFRIGRSKRGSIDWHGLRASDITGAESKRGLCGIAEIAVQRGNHLGAFADRTANPLDRPRTHVADGKHARHRGFERRGDARFAVLVWRPRHHKAGAVEHNPATLEPASGWNSVDARSPGANVS